jgi:hypothetical protein
VITKLLPLLYWENPGVQEPSRNQADRLLNLKRIKVKTWFFRCCSDASKIRILEQAEISMGKEFDVSNYIKLQKKIKALLKVVFTEQERSVLERNRRF